MIYKFTPPSPYALSNLQMHGLFCRHFADYNDPFELWAKIKDGLPEFDDNNERFQNAIAAWGFPETKKAELPLDEEDLMEYLGGLVDGAPLFIFDHARITCFSYDQKNLLMWSHYADGLRGFCIEFDESKIFKEDERSFMVPVNYADKPPVIDTFVYAVTQDLFEYAIDHGYEEYEGESFRSELNRMIRYAVASKPKEWMYEQEVRLVIITDSDDRSPVIHTYPPESVKSIIIGEKMPDEYKSQLIEAAQSAGLSIPFKIASRSPDFYELVINELG